MTPTPSEREALLAQAKAAHDLVCLCDPKYLMSCSHMAAAILALPAPRPITLQEMVEEARNDSRQWFASVTDHGRVHELVHYTLAYNGEAGELANIVKKIDRGSLTFDEARGKMVDEAIDGLVYLLNIFATLGVDVVEEYYKKRAFNERRFG